MMLRYTHPMWLLVRIAINLYYKLFRALYYPFTLLAKRSFGLLVMGGLLFVFIQFFSSPEEEAKAQKMSDKQIPVPEMTVSARQEDGNSNFASDLLKAMTPEELHHYSQTYYWVMDHQPDEQPHAWHYMNAQGTLTPKAAFKNNYGHTCRRFDELLKVRSVQQSYSGIACKKSDKSWCKLGATYTPICGIAPKTGFGAWLERTKRSLF